MKIINLSSKLFSSILLALILNTAFAGNIKELPVACNTNCISPYGTVLGVSKRGIEAYSNCNSGCVIFEPNNLKNTYTGIKWQCVEYARRWLLINKGAVYGDVDTAADIWDKINNLTDVNTNITLQLESHLNGSKQAPQVGDLLIYSKEFNNTGHVAVVLNVDYKNGFIEVGEQNYTNDLWPGNYARKIELIKKSDIYWLLDQYLLGWKHISQ
ncbi:MAG: CHAP domain-containing protein [Gammaproteobacteria bacterium]|nr:CHAP domain-containing protein [Gammaproteobacteria bacterium]